MGKWDVKLTSHGCYLLAEQQVRYVVISLCMCTVCTESAKALWKSFEIKAPVRTFKTEVIDKLRIDRHFYARDRLTQHCKIVETSWMYF